MILVDSLVDWGWKHGRSCHLFCLPEDNLENLHAFAASIGLKRQWFQSKPGRLPHYDLTARKRAAAIREGAIEVSNHLTADVIRHWRRKMEGPR